MTKPRRTMSSTLKEAIEKTGVPHAELERQTGVKRASIMRFVRGESNLRLDLADRLAEYFGIEIRWNPKGM